MPVLLMSDAVLSVVVGLKNLVMCKYLFFVSRCSELVELVSLSDHGSISASVGVLAL